MQIYLLSRTDYVDYDEYSGAVVAADCEETARDQWPGDKKWTNLDDNMIRKNYTIEDLKVELIAHHSIFKEPTLILTDDRIE